MTRFQGTFLSERLVAAWADIPAYYVTVAQLKDDERVRSAVSASLHTRSRDMINRIIDEWLSDMVGETVTTFDDETYMICYVSHGDWVLARQNAEPAELTTDEVAA